MNGARGTFLIDRFAVPKSPSDLSLLTSLLRIHLVYKRNEKKLVALARFLEDTGRYEFPKLDVPNLKLVAQNLDNASEDANKGIITAEQYYMTLLLSLPIQPVDFAGALNAIRGAEYNISLFPDIEDALIELKRTRGVKLGVVTDSMATTAEKKKWMEQAGLNTDMYVCRVFAVPTAQTHLIADGNG